MCDDFIHTAGAEATRVGVQPSYLPLRPPGPMDVFWGEIAPAEHVVQIYGRDDVYMDALEGFVSAGLRAGEGVVVIATPQHLAALDARLEKHPPHGFNLDALRRHDRYISLDAEETIARFCGPDGWPDEQKFEDVVLELLRRAGGETDGVRTRRVRAFGEMVALMWARGQKEPTVRLEELWHRVSAAQAFSLFCAYPKVGFTQDAASAIAEICAAHSKVIPG